MSGVRTNVEHESKLPEFVVVKVPGVPGPTAVALQCPRCEGVFVVNKERFTAERRATIKPDVIILGRSCPYCQVTALVPKKLRAPVAKVRRRPPRSKR